MPPCAALDQRSGEAHLPACLTPSVGFARCAEHECRAPDLPLGGQTQELSFHCVDLDEVCRDVVIAAALLGYQAEAAARECRRWTCAAQMNYRSQLLPLLTVDFRLSAMAKNRRDAPVQEHSRELCGVARHDPRIEPSRGTASLNDGMVENAIPLHLRECRVGHLVHADSTRSRLVDREQIPGQMPPPIRGCNGI